MNILVLFAHPDDEIMLGGGALVLLSHQGAALHYLCATRGEGGEPGDPPLCSLEDLGKVREAETRCAVHALGGVSLTFMDYIDPRVGPDNTLFAFQADLETFSDQIIAEIRHFAAEAVISHGSHGEYGHPGHLLVHQAVSLAVEKMGSEAPILYTVHAAFPSHPKRHLMNPQDPAHIVLDVSSVLGAKINAALCHRTQHAAFVRRISRETGRQYTVPEVIPHIEGLHRKYPPISGDDDLDDPVMKMFADSGAVIYRGTGQDVH